MDDETIFAINDMDQDLPTDESFEALERMCDKTASDPNSTLFRYLQSDETQRASADDKINDNEALDEESEALQRMLSELCVEERQSLSNECLLKGIDCTQLEDIEAPSRFWDNTLAENDTMLKTSPVKMVGLMRPSTILEGCEDDSLGGTDSSSQTSFQSALKDGVLIPSDVSTSYETANDNTTRTIDTVNNNKESVSLDVDDLFYAAIRKSNITLCQPNAAANDLIDLNDSYELIDLEATFADFPRKSENTSSKDSTCEDNKVDSKIESPNVSSGDVDESVIEIYSDDDDVVTEIKESVTNSATNIKVEQAPESTKINCSSNNLSSLSEIEPNNDKENDDDNSLQFNDTMEEVDYMMRKGMEYLTSSATKIPTAQQYLQLPTPLAPIRTNQNTVLASPNKSKSATKSNLSSPKSVSSVITGAAHGPVKTTSSKTPVSAQNAPSTGAISKKQNNFAVNIKPMPKLNLFKPPAGIPCSRQKELKQPFAHIVSPVRAYRQNTATTPFMTTIKTQQQSDMTAFRDFENETRFNQPVTSGSGRKLIGIPTVTNTLPKKAYISSEFKHVIDERTPMTIPGGKSIQKYLESAMMPTVLRHDGKLKIPGGIEALSSDDEISGNIENARSSASLANLSIMSGDISMYTMKDAQKF